jgi:hypothetical protein
MFILGRGLTIVAQKAQEQLWPILVHQSTILLVLTTN